MGLDINGTQFILHAKELGVDFSQTAMIGRQRLHLSPIDFTANLRKFGYFSDKATVDDIYTANNGYAEKLFHTLGANQVHSFDNSNYEGATHIHDMNQSIPKQYKQQYSVVFDGGTLEHIFNLPIAIKNCMEMVKIGGHYLGITPANNFMGHGFYQFSPELFFSVFTKKNGYKLVELIAFENTPNSRWYLVKSPVAINSRVTMVSRKPVYLLIVARRLEGLELFKFTPQQSDYVATWKTSDITNNKIEKGFLRTLARHYLPYWIKYMGRILLSRFNQPKTGFDPRFFQQIRRTDSSHKPHKTLKLTR